MYFTVFNAIGEILRIVNCPDYMGVLQPSVNESVISGFSSDISDYVDVYDYFTIKPKTESQAIIDNTIITANSTDIATISGITNPSTVTIENQIYEVTDGVFTFSTDLPGTYTVTVSSVEHLDKIFEVVAT